jgi:hypothetical protein
MGCQEDIFILADSFRNLRQRKTLTTSIARMYKRLRVNLVHPRKRPSSNPLLLLSCIGIRNLSLWARSWERACVNEILVVCSAAKLISNNLMARLCKVLSSPSAFARSHVNASF